MHFTPNSGSVLELSCLQACSYYFCHEIILCTAVLLCLCQTCNVQLYDHFQISGKLEFIIFQYETLQKNMLFTKCKFLIPGSRPLTHPIYLKYRLWNKRDCFFAPKWMLKNVAVLRPWKWGQRAVLINALTRFVYANSSVLTKFAVVTNVQEVPFISACCCIHAF